MSESRPHAASGGRRVWPFAFPYRAPIQTWMMLTFGLFLGIAVVGVVIYAFLILRQQLQTEATQRLMEQTARVLADLERVPVTSEFDRAVERISRLTGRRVTVVADGQVLSDWEDGERIEDETVVEQTAIRQAMAEGNGFAQTTGEDGDSTIYVALGSVQTNLIVQLGQENPPIYGVLRRTQATLILSMVLALILALIGSWIASGRITQPLQALTSIAERINEGELEEEIIVQSRAMEFHDLAHSLDAMAEHFRDDIKQLQRLIRIQNEFLGNVSHEVRNPIFAIGGYLEALSSAGLGTEQRDRYVQKGLANLDRLNTLFSDLVEIARLEYREDLIQREVFDLQGLVEEVAETARMKAEEKNLELDVANRAFYVEADRNRIAQVLTNLIENAIAYTDQGSIRCRLMRRADKVRIEVVDTGKGIGREHVERIFDRFYRVDTARSRKHGGSGLGLSIVKQIMHAHGEQIYVESAMGQGTKFWFELPFVARKKAHEQTREAEIG